MEKLIDDHLDQDTLNVSFLADKLAMDRTTLHRKVKQRFGCSTSDLIKRQRLALAKILLAEQTSNIAEIAFRTGFNSQAYFASQFKKQFNCTPKEWRIKHSLPHH